MNKDLLYKYFRYEASEKEVDRIIEWVEKSPENLDFFAEQKALWDIAEKLPVSQPATSTIQKRKILRIAYFSAAAVIILLLSVNIIFIAGKKEAGRYDFTLAAELPAEKIRTIYTEKGVKAQVTLPDNSKVWLNSDSRLTYPALFGNRTREVELSGEAYFEVTRDSLCPMIVKTNKNLAVEVLGTSFSIKSYDNDTIAKATLFTGSISMHYKDAGSNEDKVLQLKPDESFVYYRTALPEQVKYKDNTKEIAWTRGELLFDQTPVEEVLKMLERWHGTKFIVENKSIFNDKLTASFQTESIVQIMEMMKYCISLDYKINNNTITITGVKK